MSKRPEPDEVIIAKITKTAAGLFPSFGGGKVSAGNPVSHALKDAPPMFAAGVDISAVVRLTLIMSGQPGLLKACKALVLFCESNERLNNDDVCPTKAYNAAQVAIAKVTGK